MVKYSKLYFLLKYCTHIRIYQLNFDREMQYKNYLYHKIKFLKNRKGCGEMLSILIFEMEKDAMDKRIGSPAAKPGAKAILFVR